MLVPCPASCHEGETADRAAEVMARLGVPAVPVTNDADRVTGVIFADELAAALSRPSPAAPRMRDVMRRRGFLVCREDEPERLSKNLGEAAADCAVVLNAAGDCVAIVDRRTGHA